MSVLDFVATLPAFVVSAWSGVWLIKWGNKPMRNQLEFFTQLLLIAVLVTSWTVAVDFFAQSQWERWFIHIAMDYCVAAVGAIAGFFVSLARPMRRA